MQFRTFVQYMLCFFWQHLRDVKMYISMRRTRNNFGSHNKICSHIWNECVVWQIFYIANRIRKATIKQNSPIASDRANPRMAYENSCCFRDGFLKHPEENISITTQEHIQEHICAVPQRKDTPCISDDEASEHCSDSSTRPSNSNGGSSSTNKLGSSVNVPADSTGLDAPQWDLGEGALWQQSYSVLEDKRKIKKKKIKKNPKTFYLQGNSENKLQVLWVQVHRFWALYSFISILDIWLKNQNIKMFLFCFSGLKHVLNFLQLIKLVFLIPRHIPISCYSLYTTWTFKKNNNKQKHLFNKL